VDSATQSNTDDQKRSEQSDKRDATLARRQQESDTSRTRSNEKRNEVDDTRHGKQQRDDTPVEVSPQVAVKIVCALRQLNGGDMHIREYRVEDVGATATTATSQGATQM
jgi:chromatin remodeling complex protein RSC6